MLKRTFSYVDQNNNCHTVVAIIDTPIKQERPINAVPEMPDTYSCAFQVTGADLNINGVGVGIDEFAAVFAALRYLRSELDTLGNRIKFLDNEGYTGIPRMVTLGDTIAAQRRIEAVLDNEHKNRFDELQAKVLAAETKRAADKP